MALGTGQRPWHHEFHSQGHRSPCRRNFQSPPVPVPADVRASDELSHFLSPSLVPHVALPRTAEVAPAGPVSSPSPALRASHPRPPRACDTVPAASTDRPVRLSRSGSNTDMSLQLVLLPLPQPALPFLQCDVLCPWRGRQESRSAGLASSGDAFSWMRGHVS